MISISSLLLKSSTLRRSIIPHLKSSYFHELNLSIPLTNGLKVPLLENDSYNSFSEIFVHHEYEEFLPPGEILKIVDLGAHYGYFSLWLQNKFQGQAISSLMIEASSLCQRTLNDVCKLNCLNGRFQYLARAVGDPIKDKMEFFDRPFMASSKFGYSDFQKLQKIKILKQSEVIEALPPPYDLIKCDIEGSEFEFILHYPELLKNAKFLILEWHSWHSGGGGFNQITDCLKKRDYEIIQSSPPLSAIGVDGEVGLLLAKNKSYSS